MAKKKSKKTNEPFDSMPEKIDFDEYKQGSTEHLKKFDFKYIDEGILEVVKVMNAHPDVCTLESCMGRLDIIVYSEENISTNPPKIPLTDFHQCCSLCSQGGICVLRKLAVSIVHPRNLCNYNYITMPMTPENRFDWTPKYRKEWSHGLKRFDTPLTSMDIEDILAGLNIPDGYAVLLELSLPYLNLMCRDIETGLNLLKSAHSAGWVYSFFQYSPQGSRTKGYPPLDLHEIMIWEQLGSVKIPLGNSKASLPPPEQLEQIVKVVNTTLEKAQAKIPALERISSSIELNEE